ncbi:MAG TPA: hypothetical protein VIV15_07525 [Anaerolineales bacterium]
MAKKSEGQGSKQRHVQKQDQERESDNISGYRQKIHENKKAEANKSKSGCLPKVFMLLLPFTAVGAYLLLRA